MEMFLLILENVRVSWGHCSSNYNSGKSFGNYKKILSYYSHIGSARENKLFEHSHSSILLT